MTAVMSSAILAAPGPDTGELMVGYPFTSVSTSSTEIVKIQLRVYLSAVLKRPENVIIMRDVFFEGLHSGYGSKVATNALHYSECVFSNRPLDLVYVQLPEFYLESSQSVVDLKDFTADGMKNYKEREGRTLTSDEQIAFFESALQLTMANVLEPKQHADDTDAKRFMRMLEDERPTKLFMGAHRPTGGGDIVPNCGHLGVLDSPAMVDRLFGSFVYNDHGPR